MKLFVQVVLKNVKYVNKTIVKNVKKNYKFKKNICTICHNSDNSKCQLL